MGLDSKYDTEVDDNDSICPYCKHRYQVESEDFDEEDKEVECDECGKKYYQHQSFMVSTFTTPDCELNGEEHEWRWITLRNGKRHQFCAICDKCRPHATKKANPKAGP